MKNSFIVIIVFALASCNLSDKKKREETTAIDTGPNYRLELVWASDSLLKTPESVLFDRERDVLYISNVNQNPWEKDGNGFISKMDLSGNIIELEWVGGLSGPKGMGVYSSTLYVTDIDEVVEVDIGSGLITRRTVVEGKPDLNDITVGDDGTVYVSGSSSNTIYALKDGVIEEFQKGGEERYNGLFWEKDRLLLLTSGSSEFKAIDWKTKEVTILSKNMGAGDGIAPVGDGGYLTSSWNGTLFYVSSSGEVTKLLDTEARGENTADIDYSMEDNRLFVPTFFDNRVKAFKLVGE